MAGAVFLITMAVSGLLVLLLPAVLVAVAHSELELATEMLLLFAVGGFAVVAVVTALQGRIKQIERAFTYLALVGVWTVTPIICAVFFVVLAEMAFLPAWFEAAGALTTSGASVLVKEQAPKGLLFWRSLCEWYGGFLTLASIVHVLAPAGFGGLQSDSRMLSTKPGEGLFRVQNYNRLALQYTLVTGLIFLGLILFGVEPLDAVMLGMISAATGGFLPFSGPLEESIGGGATTVMAFSGGARSSGIRRGRCRTIWKPRSWSLSSLS
jgi:trk system potassium uptake protein TrkH